MALFNSIPAVSTQKDTTKPIGKKPSSKVTKEDLEVKAPLTVEEEDLILKDRIKELDEEASEPIYFEDDEDLPKVEEKKVIEKKEVKEEPKKANEAKAPSKPLKVAKAEEKPEVKKEPEPKKEEKPIKKVVAPKPLVKEEPKVEEKPEEKPIVEEKVEQKMEEKEPERPLTLEEKKARQMENLRKARLARQAQQAKENDNMATKKEEKPKKLVTETKKPVDMSKMIMTAKPKKDTSGKTVYHVSKRGETREDRVWKVFIQESNKVIKLFDYQEEALDYAKQLAKNKNDGSYVILHGLNGKIRKF
ncbi:neurofilament heavy polypeptide [Anaeroplasma bactoclasticum]|jgi:neurofilament heavy polypeptide|uniref:Neurofilament heavy polypeptide n=1 Tax=Anaeroplasma bactoclasticum TaxID=2088 RepID=A0A397S171_9MOLU|nr:DUF2188 domain-containing protein [Anaeroplasma bactoclasticum]RIA78155.1 neurofilament heavy polypeptide [Anaeroplasma bactoclasticum]